MLSARPDSSGGLGPRPRPEAEQLKMCVEGEFVQMMKG